MTKLPKQIVQSIANRFGYTLVNRRRFPPDFGPDEIAIVEDAQPYTMTSRERLFSLIQAVRHVVRHDIPGAIVECGVWKGGSMRAAARTLIALGRQDRDLYLFDTFEGMSTPTELDVRFDGTSAAETFEQKRTGEDRADWCRAEREEVAQVMHATGYDQQRIHMIQGRVEDTIPEHAPEQIAILRLDTDWYESTLHEFTHLYPRLSPGGIVIVDDYGCWHGARRATDEYIEREGLELLLQRIDATARLAVKPGAPASARHS